MAAARSPMTRAALQVPGERARRARRGARDRSGRGRGPCRSRRGQVAVQKRLEVAVGRRQPGSLLDLQHELASGGSVRPGPDDDEMARIGEVAAIASAPVVSRAPSASRRSIAATSTGRPDRCAPTAARGEDRTQVADRVAPALVELARLDRDAGEGPGRRPPAHCDDRGRPARVTGRLERRPRGGGRRLRA